MAAIYLIRHGQASFGKENYDQLSELGETQATRLGLRLRERLPAFDAVAMGGMWRHEQTASRCLAGFGSTLNEMDAQVDTGWNEYDHQKILGAFRPEFVTAASMTAFIRQQKNPRAFFEEMFNGAVNRWISGEHDSDYDETWVDFNERVHGALKRVMSKNPNARNMAVFTSGGPISVLSQALLGVDPKKIMHMNWTLINCGVTKLVSTGSRLFVSSLNEHTHFEGSENKHLITYT